MTSIPLSFDFDAEQLAAIDARLTDELPTRAALLSNLVSGEVARYVATDYEVAVARVAAAVRPLPYESRLALISQLEAPAQ